jgi:hypothetical protein
MCSCGALVLIHTLLLGTHHRAGRTDTVEGANSVDTVPTIAQTWNSLAFVDVHALSGVDILQEARVTVQLGGTALTGVTPGCAYGCTAELLGTHHTLQLSSALLALNVAVARPSAVVYLTVAPSVAIHTGTAIRSYAATSILTLLLTHRLLTELPGITRAAEALSILTSPAIQTSGATPTPCLTESFF